MADGVEAIGSRRHFKYIVVGCGGIGSAAVYWLSKRAPGDVLGLEQFELGHHNGGSQDLSRGIRLAYHDDRYVRLAPAAYDCWSEVERESGQRLLFKTGGVQLAVKGTAGEQVLKAYYQAMTRHNIPYERLTSAQLRARFPQFTTGPEVEAFYQKDAGIVDAALANSTHLQLAQGKGAVVIDRCPVLRIRRDPSTSNLQVTTTKGTFSCERLVVSAGAWLNDVLGSIGVHVPVTVTQEQVTYMATPHIKEFTKDRFPLWCFHTETNDVYALPAHGNSGTKIGIDAAGPHVTGNTRTFTPDPARVKICTDLVKKILPKFLGPEMYTKTCLYTMTSDRDFVVDTCARQGYSDVIVCCGGGHAFKFAGVLGKILAELAVDGASEHDISGFSMNRPAVSQPDYKPVLYMGSAPTAAKL